VLDPIRRKRDGGALTRAEIERFVRGVTSGSVPDYQAAALLMAIYFRGMNADETAWLTGAMVASGERLDLGGIRGRKVDKHSTGGVGDKTSLVLAPLAAACGLIVPMMSGRALGHTGGTLDKLEAIPGYRTRLSLEELRRALGSIGCAIVGQTDEIAPADRALYGLRDVTCTVDSIPLIAASIMSKKIAEGIDALVLDVKTGRGAFMREHWQARELAATMVEIGRSAGVATVAVITRMDAPLGGAVGNTLEVIEAIETLEGRGPADVEELVSELTARMLVLGGLSAALDEGKRQVRAALASGAGLARFREMIAQQGGDSRVVDDPSMMPMAKGRFVIHAPRRGILRALDANAVGRTAIALGAGRTRLDADIDRGVGVLVHARPGDALEQGRPILELIYRDAASLAAAAPIARAAIEIGDEPPAPSPLIVETVE
jgi:pyrimidine-nucleoside phosphorylase